MTNNRAIGVKKSDLGAGTSLSDTATLDFVENNINKKITYSNFLSNLGVSGSIIQTGKSTGTPILNKAGTVNKIRNLTAGTGISLTLDAFNSVEISSTVQSSSTTTVNSVADLPTAVAGVITLAANTTYIIGSSFTTADRFAVSDGTSIVGASSSFPVITYSGTGNMFTGADARFTIRDVGVRCVSAELFDMDGTGLATSALSVENVNCVSCTSYATLKNLKSVCIVNSSCDTANGGITFDGSLNWKSVKITGNTFQNFPNGTTTFDLGAAVIPFINIDKNFVEKLPAASGNTFMSGLTLGGNIPSGGQLIVKDNYSDMVTPITTMSQRDNRVLFRDNAGITDTKYWSLVYTHGTATTPITVSNTPTIMLNTFVTSALDNRTFTKTTAGRITNAGDKTIVAKVTLIASMMPATGTNVEMGLYIAIGGTEVSASEVTGETDANKPIVMTTELTLSIAAGGYVEPFVENQSGLEDIDVVDAFLEVTW